MREMRAIHFVTKLIEQGKLDGDTYKRMNMHMVEACTEMHGLGASSKLIVEPQFLDYLRSIGYRTADDWLKKHGDNINRTSTLDLAATFF
jgi:NTE family protein